MKFKKKILKLLGFECFHESVKNENCKFCPDCGKKVLIKWVTVKCRQCGYYRKPYTSFLNKILPLKKYCCFCGSDNWGYHYYYDASISEKLKMISERKVEEEMKFAYKFGDMSSNVDIWVESPDKNDKKRGVNFVKFVN